MRDMNQYDLADRLVDGVRADLFIFGLIPGGACFLLSSIGFFIRDGWHTFWRDELPWVTAASLLFAVFVAGAMINVALRNQVERVVKQNQGTLTVRLCRND